LYKFEGGVWAGPRHITFALKADLGLKPIRFWVLYAALKRRSST
jgi:hypothetical protein